MNATPDVPPAGFYPLGNPPVRCERCRWPVVLDYDGPNTGWSHLYPGSAEGTVECTMPPPEDLSPCGCYADDPGCPPEHAEFNRVARSRDVRDHENAGHTVTELPYDPDLGEDQWHCQQCQVAVVVPGWSVL